jgi:hypothetical protein
VTSEPTFLLESGVVIGTDVTTGAWNEGRPWLWSALTGRRYLGLDGASWAVVSDARNVANVVGTLYRIDEAGTQHSTAVRWLGTRPVPLMPDAAGDTIADAASPRGDVAVREFTPGGATAWLLSPGKPPTDLGLFFGRGWTLSLNSARQAVLLSYGPGTISPTSIGVWEEGVNSGFLSGYAGFQPCASDITESGYVAGTQLSLEPTEVRRDSALWHDGTATPLPADGMSPLVACTVDGVNEAGHVVGSLLRPQIRPGEPVPVVGPERAVMWRDGAVSTLFTDTDARTVRPVGVTNRDVVLAQVGTPAAARTGVAVLSGGVWTDLPVPAGLTDVVAVEINERNQVVGSGVRTAADGTTRRVPILWSPAEAR